MPLPNQRDLGQAIRPPQVELDFNIDQSCFETGQCCNCAAAMVGPYCHICGQKQAKRLGHRDVTSLAWSNLRWFEFDLLRALATIILTPGRVARDYVLGKRQRTVHPFKIYLTAVVVLMLVIDRSGYFAVSDEKLGRAIALVQSWSKWSFALGILAILPTSLVVFWRRHGFNWVEHLTLAAYAHSAVLVANALNILPLLLIGTPAMVAAHRSASASYMNWIEGAIVALAFAQFFAIDLRKYWFWPILGAIAFFLVKKLLIAGYARLVVHIVMAQLS